MLPPFDWKMVADDERVAEVIERVGERLRIYLYHIRPGLDTDLLVLIERACWKGSKYHCRQHPAPRRTPRLLIRAASTCSRVAKRRQIAGAGHATANVNPWLSPRSLANGRTPTPNAPTAVDAVRAVFQKFPMIPVLVAVADRSQDGWYAVRPPLVTLAAEQRTNDALESAVRHDAGVAAAGAACVIVAVKSVKRRERRCASGGRQDAGAPTG